MNNYYEAIDTGNEQAAIKLFLSRNVLQNNEEKYGNKQSAAVQMIELLEKTSCEWLLAEIKAEQFPVQKIEPSNIPQFSDLSFMDNIVGIVKANPGETYDTFGYFYAKESGYEANRKFGDNHYKLASQAGLTTWRKPLKLTALGEAYFTLNNKERDMVRAKLFFQIPIIQKILVKAEMDKVDVKKTLMEYGLAESTATRRRSSVKALIRQICLEIDNGDKLYNNLK